jgi:hypothetical protein
VRLHDPLSDRAGRGAVLVDRPPVQRPPHPVRAQGPVEDRLVHVQLRVAFAGIVLQELGDDEPRRVDPPPAPTAMVADAGVPGLVLQIVDRRGGTGQHGVLDGLGMHRPRRGGLMVPGRGGFHGRPLERDAEHGDRLRRGERHVDERHRLARRTLGLRAQLGAVLRAGVRVGLQQAGVDLVRAAVPAVRGRQRRRLRPRLTLVGRRVAGVEQVRVDGLHQVGINGSAQPQLPGAGAVPEPRRLAGADGSGVVALVAAGDRPGQIAHVVAGGDAQRHPTTRTRSTKWISAAGPPGRAAHTTGSRCTGVHCRSCRGCVMG